MISSEALVEASLVTTGDSSGALITLDNWQQNIKKIDGPPIRQVEISLEESLGDKF
eukprot:COSAG05_NODE_14659_length_391_cov_0.561644_1_plen_55_part_10